MYPSFVPAKEDPFLFFGDGVTDVVDLFSLSCAMIGSGEEGEEEEGGRDQEG